MNRPDVSPGSDLGASTATGATFPENVHPLPVCPDPLPSELNIQIEHVADLWAKSPARPRIAPAIARHWDDLIKAWSEDESLPLLVRKSESGIARGEIFLHESGRQLVSTDNSPASWSYMLAIAGERPDIARVSACLAADEIPVAMIVDREMRARSRYKCSRVSIPNPNSLGWKVCHKHRVALRGRGPLAQRRIEDLRSHFRDFLSPSNIFLVPLVLAGLGELPQFIAAIGRESGGL